MALIVCPECGHEVSDTAITCPNCGFTLKKELDNQKRNNFLKKYKVGIIIAVVAVCVLIYGIRYEVSKPDLYIKDFMAQYDISLSDWKLAFGEPSTSGYGVYKWQNCELIENITGQLELYTIDSKIIDWQWNILGDDDTYNNIKRAFEDMASGNLSLEGYDKSSKFEWLDYTEGTYSMDWTIGEEKITDEAVKGWTHSLVLLKEGDNISLQYVPTNHFYGFNTRYYDID